MKQPTLLGKYTVLFYISSTGLRLEGLNNHVTFTRQVLIKDLILILSRDKDPSTLSAYTRHTLGYL